MEEYFGITVDKAARFLYSRRLKKWPLGSPLVLRENVARFTILATPLAGKEVRVVDLRGDARPRPYGPILAKMAHPAILPEHGFGWSDTETLFLPVSIADMPTVKAQNELARYLIFFLTAQIRHGSLSFARTHSVLLQRDQALADLFWIIENTRLYKRIERDFPALFRDWDANSVHLLGRRPGVRFLRESELKVEEFFVAAILGDLEFDPLALVNSNASPKASLEMAKRVKAKWIEEGLSFKRYRAFVPFAAWGRLLPDRIKESDEFVESEEAKSIGDAFVTSEKGDDKSEKDERSRYLAKKEIVDEEACEQGLVLNIYDKVLSWAEFVKVSRPFDDDPDEDSDKKADQLEELSTAETIRSAGSSFNADLETEGDPGDRLLNEEATSAKVYLYPEWDYQKKIYRDGHSRLLEENATRTENGFVGEVLRDRRGIIKDVRRKFEMLTPENRRMSRQMEGDEIDIDAVVESLASRAAGKEPGEKFYISTEKAERDLSVLFLVDQSMSTDAWVKDKRVIDHEKEALVVLSEAMEVLKDRYAICGFSGKTRGACRYYNIKGFDEGYNDAVKERIGALIPYQYTRMGPAIRHATHILNKEQSRTKLLFIISDGKPNDMDAYEGRYGVEDTRMAIKGAEKDGIIPFCLTVDSTSSTYLPRIFGSGNYAVLAGVDKLTRKLPELYARIVGLL
ncbi:MAG: VWA domain-containing protein [Thermodesulfobacteriota bacterium]